MEIIMRIKILMLGTLSALALAACAKKEEVAAAPPPPPPPPGAVAGSMAADRDGDGIIDGYYSADGIYHANQPPMPAPAPAPVYASRQGERG
jgi:hypothetical protein